MRIFGAAIAMVGGALLGWTFTTPGDQPIASFLGGVAIGYGVVTVCMARFWT